MTRYHHTKHFQLGKNWRAADCTTNRISLKLEHDNYLHRTCLTSCAWRQEWHKDSPKNTSCNAVNGALDVEGP